jgi:cation diffusion facilitator family transporter
MSGESGSATVPDPNMVHVDHEVHEVGGHSEPDVHGYGVHHHDLAHGHDHGGGGDDHGSHDHGVGDQNHGRNRLVGFLAGIFSPHSHGAAESIDSALTSSAEGIRALKIGLGGLAVTAAFQVVIVVISGSVALLGDTIHNFADALTAIPLGVAFVLGRRPPNNRYTYGYGRSEDLAGIFVVAVIAFSSALAAWEATQRLFHPRLVHHVAWVALAGLVGFAGNELVAVYRIRVGRKIGSAALVADGLHARTDGLTSLAVVIGALGVAVGWRLADPLVGLLITVAILFVLKGAARDIYRRLMDSVEPELVDQVQRVLASVPGVQAVESVRIRWLGHELRAEAEIVSDADLTLAAAHDIAEDAHHRLLHQIPRLGQATIHSSPCGHDGRDHHAETSHHFPGRSQAAAPVGSSPDLDRTASGAGPGEQKGLS